MKKIILLALILVLAATFTAAVFQTPAAGTSQAPAASGITVPPAYAGLPKGNPPKNIAPRVGWNT